MYIFFLKINFFCICADLSTRATSLVQLTSLLQALLATRYLPVLPWQVLVTGHTAGLYTG
jgi:hypothetical protein